MITSYYVLSFVLQFARSLEVMLFVVALFGTFVYNFGSDV